MKRFFSSLLIVTLLIITAVLVIMLFGKQIRQTFSGMGGSLGGETKQLTRELSREAPRRESMATFDSQDQGARPATTMSRMVMSPTPEPAARPLDTEEYDSVAENRFMDVAVSPLSTLSIDVDTASYANVRRMIKAGRFPTSGAVRLEEMINYFGYTYPEPDGDIPLAFEPELASCPWNADHQLLLLGIQARRIALEQLPPNNLVFLLDVSGSMNNPDKLPLLTSALRLLVGELRPQDRVAIVVYAGAAGLALPSTSGADKPSILTAIDGLRAGGSTAGGAGINLAYQVAEKHLNPSGNNRVILATDGDFNVGASSQSALVELIEEKRKTGIYLTVLGFGTGNYSDARMEKLADQGNGNYAYIDSLMEAQKVLVTELGGTLVTVANDVKIQIEFNPAAVSSYRLVGYENRVMRAEDFADDTKDAGELGAGHRVTVLYEIVPAGSETPAGSLKYQTSQLSPEALESGELATIHFRYKLPGEASSLLFTQAIPSLVIGLDKTSDNFRFATAVAQWGMLLRDSEHKGTASYDEVLRLAKSARGEDEFGYRSEFLQLVRTSQSLAKTNR